MPGVRRLPVLIRSLPEAIVSEYFITSVAEADPQDLEHVLAGLRSFNEVHAGSPHLRIVNLLLRDRDNAVRGGLLGKQLWGWLYLDTLWVDEGLRGFGWGGNLLHQAEVQAREDGCTRALLDTFEFQARPFYEQAGYTVFAELENFPPGWKRYYMVKELVPECDS
jgi:GNAT superfamily N-acetyltransferase